MKKKYETINQVSNNQWARKWQNIKLMIIQMFTDTPNPFKLIVINIHY